MKNYEIKLNDELYYFPELKTKHLTNGLVKEETATITLGYACELHVEEVREQLEDAKQSSEKQEEK